MTLVCPDCGQRTALVKVSIFVDAHDTSIESLSEQVSEILGMQPDDFPDEAEVVCTACEAEVPYRLALVATHRADAHQEAKKDVEAYEYAIHNMKVAWSNHSITAGGVYTPNEHAVTLNEYLSPSEEEEE